MGELLGRRRCQHSVSSARCLRGGAIAPAVALKAQSQATQGGVIHSRTSTGTRARTHPALGQDLTRSSTARRAQAAQTKGAVTDMLNLKPPRHTPTLRTPGQQGLPRKARPEVPYWRSGGGRRAEDSCACRSYINMNDLREHKRTSFTKPPNPDNPWPPFAELDARNRRGRPPAYLH
jgi:hypothetical protein